VAANFLEDYVKVDDLIKRMNEEYPKGRLVTELVNQIDDLVVFKATFFNGDSDPICTGHGAEKIKLDKKLEKAESVARGRCLRVLFSEKPLFEEMEGIAPRKQTMPKKASKSTIDTKVERLEDEDIVKDLSKSQSHIINNVKDFAMAATNHNETNAKAFYIEAISKMGIKEDEININNMQNVKNKIQDIVTFNQTNNDKGE
tara:strand:- start:7300 stop:7902 length:603 start_codon:yes stop_codon:yes gene_type:complete